MEKDQPVISAENDKRKQFPVTVAKTLLRKNKIKGWLVNLVSSTAGAGNLQQYSIAMWGEIKSAEIPFSSGKIFVPKRSGLSYELLFLRAGSSCEQSKQLCNRQKSIYWFWLLQNLWKSGWLLLPPMEDRVCGEVDKAGRRLLPKLSLTLFRILCELQLYSLLAWYLVRTVLGNQYWILPTVLITFTLRIFLLTIFLKLS